MGVGGDGLTEYCGLVEGINDLIKKRLGDGEDRLRGVYEGSGVAAGGFLFEAVAPYYAYCLFANEKYE